MEKPAKPRKVHIDVTEGGKQTANLRMPFGLFRLGMKYGSQAAAAETDGCAKAMAQLKGFDCSAFERAVTAGTITLPHPLLDAFDEQQETHVVITAER